jgi:predicted AAA+ superfamily ATPase
MTAFSVDISNHFIVQESRREVGRLVCVLPFGLAYLATVRTDLSLTSLQKLKSLRDISSSGTVPKLCSLTSTQSSCAASSRGVTPDTSLSQD